MSTRPGGRETQSECEREEGSFTVLIWHENRHVNVLDGLERFDPVFEQVPLLLNVSQRAGCCRAFGRTGAECPSVYAAC